MDKKIEGFIRQCTKVEKGLPNWDMTANTKIVTFDKEQFAELIIRDCAKFVYEATADTLALDLLSHYGIIA